MADPNDNYSLVVGLIFLFNLLLGTGVLTIPAVFAQAGYVVGVVVMMALCFMSYIQVTFLIESMANANFVKRVLDAVDLSSPADKDESTALLSNSEDVLSEIEDDDIDDKGGGRLQNISTDQYTTLGLVSNSSPSINEQPNGMDNPAYVDEAEDDAKGDAAGTEVTYESEVDPEIQWIIPKLKSLRPHFEISEKFELGDMTQMFLNRTVSQLFFFSIIVYLFGDLMIYNTMMAKSLREISCTSKKNCSDASRLDAPCWDSMSITRRNVYRIYLTIFIALLLPLVYAGLKKTSSIQIVTIVMRWLAFISMVGIAVKIFVQHEATGHPKAMSVTNIPRMFGICVYAFMCHHSVPSILTPVRHKRNLIKGLTVNYFLVISCYLLVSLTAIFAFGNLADVYTLNFQINDCPENDGPSNSTNPGNVPVLDIFLPTYPIFTLFSSYTMIAITLINNMKVLSKNWCDIATPALHYSFPLIAIIPAMLVSLFTEDVSAIVSYVGSYAGGLIQYVFPCLLVYYSRRHVKQEHLVPFIQRKLPSMDAAQLNIDRLYRITNSFASPFQRNCWLVVTAIWWVLSLILVTVSHISDAINHQ